MARQRVRPIIDIALTRKQAKKILKGYAIHKSVMKQRVCIKMVDVDARKQRKILKLEQELRRLKGHPGEKRGYTKRNSSYWDNYKGNNPNGVKGKNEGGE
jgi:hypothetical protein